MNPDIEYGSFQRMNIDDDFLIDENSCKKKIKELYEYIKNIHYIVKLYTIILIIIFIFLIYKIIKL